MKSRKQVNENNSMNQSWLVKYTYLLVAIFLTVYAMIVAKSLLQPLLFAIFFSILLTPSCGWMERKGVPRMLSVPIGITVSLLILIGIGFFLYSQLTAFASDVDIFQQRFKEILETLQGFLAGWFGFEGLLDVDMIIESFQQFIRDNTGSLTRGLAGAASVFTSIFLVPVFMFFMLSFRDFLSDFFLQIFGGSATNDYEKIKSIIDRVKEVVQGYITGVIIVILILAVLNSVMLLVIGVEHAIFFGVFAAMLNVIPFVGPLLGSILPILYSLFTMDSLIIPLVIMGGFYIIQLMESNIFTPIIVGNKVSLNAFAALLLLFIGAQIWGIIGMILIVPIGAIFKVVFDEIESLKPYGFVLGTVPDRYRRENNIITKKLSRFSEKVSDEMEEKKKSPKKGKSEESGGI